MRGTYTYARYIHIYAYIFVCSDFGASGFVGRFQPGAPPLWPVMVFMRSSSLPARARQRLPTSRSLSSPPALSSPLARVRARSPADSPPQVPTTSASTGAARPPTRPPPPPKAPPPGFRGGAPLEVVGRDVGAEPPLPLRLDPNHWRLPPSAASSRSTMSRARRGVARTFCTCGPAPSRGSMLWNSSRSPCPTTSY